VHLLAAVSPVARRLVFGTAAVWFVLELRQSLNHRPEAVEANWASELVFRLAIAVGVLMVTVLSRAVPAAAIPPAAA
jgi:hypothetical protein